MAFNRGSPWDKHNKLPRLSKKMARFQPNAPKRAFPFFPLALKGSKGLMT